jgi:hypothetical protein
MQVLYKAVCKAWGTHNWLCMCCGVMAAAICFTPVDCW